VRAGATATDPDLGGFRIDDVAETSLTLTTTLGTNTVAVTVPNIVPGHFVQVIRWRSRGCPPSEAA